MLPPVVRSAAVTSVGAYRPFSVSAGIHGLPQAGGAAAQFDLRLQSDRLRSGSAVQASLQEAPHPSQQVPLIAGTALRDRRRSQSYLPPPRGSNPTAMVHPMEIFPVPSLPCFISALHQPRPGRRFARLAGSWRLVAHARVVDEPDVYVLMRRVPDAWPVPAYHAQLPRHLHLSGPSPSEAGQAGGSSSAPWGGASKNSRYWLLQVAGTAPGHARCRPSFFEERFPTARL